VVAVVVVAVVAAVPGNWPDYAIRLGPANS
jgi:hypothetical protein